MPGILRSFAEAIIEKIDASEQNPCLTMSILRSFSSSKLGTLVVSASKYLLALTDGYDLLDIDLYDDKELTQTISKQSTVECMCQANNT